MNAGVPGSTETWPVAQQSALAQTTPAVFIGDLPGAFAYAVTPHDGDIDVQGFPDRESLHRALAADYTSGSKWQWPQSWDRVFVFEQDKPVKFYMVIEDEDGDGGVA